MTPEEAIERINEHIAIHRYNEPQAIRIAEALQMGIYALEKQMSKKPTLHKGWLYCSVCGKDVLMEGYKFCPDCGQRIDWSEEE